MTDEIRDIAVLPTVDGRGLEMHRARCQWVCSLADAGHPVLTMFGCEGETPAWVTCGVCMGGGVCGPPGA